MDKEFILDEIRRVSAEEGGTPPGASRFSRETGIRPSDWAGRYWARWSDALVEAGFVPNRLQGAYDDSLVLEAYAILARELGHLPVKTELMLRRRSDSAFPSHNVFTRLGSAEVLRSKLVSFCAERPGFDDVAALCEEQRTIGPANVDTEKSDSSDFGFVYLIRSGRYYKIGKTNAAGRRERELAIQLPDKVTTVHVIRTDDPDGIEDYWHRRFAACVAMVNGLP